MSTNQARKVLQFKERFKKEAEELLFSGFPTTILKLNSILNTPKFKKRDFKDIDGSVLTIKTDLMLQGQNKGDTYSPPAKRPRFDETASQTGVSSKLLQINKQLTELVETVKPFMIKLVEDAKVMKLWISYLIPKMEDGNNFGVEIQEETLTLVHAIESCSALFYESISNYFTKRAKIVKKIIKYPDIEDFRRAVQELDERQYVTFCLVMSDIRNQYCTLHDVFLKNLDKLKAPRPNHPIESMY